MRGVSDKSIDIAVFTDANNTAQPGLDQEFPQFANAFADWCNAAGGIDGRHVVVDTEDGALFNSIIAHNTPVALAMDADMRATKMPRLAKK